MNPGRVKLIVILLLLLALGACGTPYTSRDPVCPNVHPFTPKEHWCDPYYRPAR